MPHTPSHAFLQCPIDVHKWCRYAKSDTFSLSPDACSTALHLVAPLQGRYAFTYTQGLPFLTLTVQTEVEMPCTLCGVSCRFTIDTHMEAVLNTNPTETSEKALASLGFDVLFIDKNDTLWQCIESELYLELPPFPQCSSCKAPIQQQENNTPCTREGYNTDNAEHAEEAVQRPFADLKSMLAQTTKK